MEWDNNHSWMRSKTLQYTLTLQGPEIGLENFSGSSVNLVDTELEQGLIATPRPSSPEHLRQAEIVTDMPLLSSRTPSPISTAARPQDVGQASTDQTIAVKWEDTEAGKSVARQLAVAVERFDMDLFASEEQDEDSGSRGDDIPDPNIHPVTPAGPWTLSRVGHLSID